MPHDPHQPEDEARDRRAEAKAGSEVEDELGTDDSLVERLRSSPVGTNDPNIVGDAGPADIPPGRD